MFVYSVILFTNCNDLVCASDCPYSCLTDGPVEQRLSRKDNKLILLNYLLSELQAARISAARAAACLHNDFNSISTSDAVLSLLCQFIFTTVVFF